MPLATKPLAQENAELLGEICRWHRLKAIHQASLSPTVTSELGELGIGTRVWQTSLRTSHSYSSSRTLQLRDETTVLKFRSHAYRDTADATVSRELLAQQNRTENPTVFWYDSYPYLQKLRAIHKTAGHISIQSAPIFKEIAGPQVMSVEAAIAISIDQTEELIREVGGFMLTCLPPEIEYVPDVHDGMNPAY